MVTPRTISNSLTGLIDLFATIEDIIDSKSLNSDAQDSISFLPILKNRSAKTRETIINHSAKGMFAIRSKDWKFIDGLGSGGQSRPYTHLPQRPGETGQLYSFKDDCWENVNFYLSKKSIVSDLKEKLENTKKKRSKKTED